MQKHTALSVLITLVLVCVLLQLIFADVWSVSLKPLKKIEQFTIING